jgi:putative ABC transport system substrate-binding protein
MSKKLGIVIAVVIVVTIVVGSFWVNRSVSSKGLYHIGVTQLMTNPGIDAIRDGFLDEMSKLGYIEGENIRYTLKNSQGDNSISQSIAKGFVNVRCDMIFAITTPTVQVCAKEIKGTNIPLVFGAVTDPVTAGLVSSLENPGGNITGTSDKWPTSAQFDLLLQLCPNVKRIGVVYNPGETNSEDNMREIEKVCAEKGLQLLKVGVANTSEVLAAAQSLVGRIDAFYVSADNTVITAMDAVIRVSEQNKIPLLPGVSSNVEQGGFGTLGPNYFDIGVESARIADRIIKGEKVGNIPVATATKFEYFFNLKSAEATGVVIPDSLLNQATQVYK